MKCGLFVLNFEFENESGVKFVSFENAHAPKKHFQFPK